MTKLALFMVIPLLLAALGGVIIVDVREGGTDGARVCVPVPLALAQIALPFVPDHARRVDLAEAEPWLPIAASMIDELKRLPDFTLAEVREADSHVLVRKEGGDLLIEVDDGPDERVRCRLPLRTARSVLHRCRDGQLRVDDLVRAVQFMPGGRLVHVRDGEAEVRITKL